MPTSGILMPAAWAWRRNHVDQPALGLGLGLVDQDHAGGPLGHPLGNHQGDEGATEAEHRGHQQELAVLAEAYPEIGLQDAQHQPSSTITARLVATSNAIRLNMTTPFTPQLRPVGFYYVSSCANFKSRPRPNAVQHRPLVRPSRSLRALAHGPIAPGLPDGGAGQLADGPAQGGEWLVRIEDLDPPREVPGMAQRQLQALAAFGLVSDGPVVWQSERSGLYAQALRRLIDAGLAFECRCSRTDLAGSGGIHRTVRRASVRARSRPGGCGFPRGRSASRTAIRGHFEQSVAR